MNALVALAVSLPCWLAATPEPTVPAPRATSQPVTNRTSLAFIDTSFENASRLWYDFAPDGTINVHLLHDYERSSPNRAAGQIHFLLHGTPGSNQFLFETVRDAVRACSTRNTAARKPLPRT